MSGLCTETVRAAHAYTRTDVPWELDAEEAAEAACTATADRRFGSRLYQYLASGGMRTFGRTVRQMQAAHRQRRFAVAAVVFAVVWLWLWLV